MKNLLVCYLIILSCNNLFACDCEYGGDFLKVAPNKSLIALIKVSNFIDEQSMEVEIIEIFKGTEIRKSVTVWGDDGKSCLPYLSEFKKGKQYVIAFDIHKSSKNMGQDYEISVCGQYWLEVKVIDQKTVAFSDVKNRETKLDIAVIRKKLKKINDKT